MDDLPFVTDVYKRDLVIEDYFIGYLLHPYVSLYTGRGCRSKCTFCLWPQTIGGHRYRTRSAGNVAAEISRAKEYFPQVKEFFFDDDTFTDDLPRAEDVARRLAKIGVTWSCNAKANVPYETLRVLRENGLRLLLVGYETGVQEILNNIRKGTRIDVARKFTEDCHKLGITIHGTFIVGLPGETPDTIERDDPVRERDQPPHDPGLARGAVSGDGALSPGAGQRLAHRRREDARRRRRSPDQLARVPGPFPRGDLRGRRAVLSPVLLPPPENGRDAQRDDPEPADDEAPAARRARVLLVPLPPRGERLSP